MSAFAADPDAIRGAITPLVTPFGPDGSLDLETVARLVEFQLEPARTGSRSAARPASRSRRRSPSASR